MNRKKTVKKKIDLQEGYLYGLELDIEYYDWLEERGIDTYKAIKKDVETKFKEGKLFLEFLKIKLK